MAIPKPSKRRSVAIAASVILLALLFGGRRGREEFRFPRPPFFSGPAERPGTVAGEPEESRPERELSGGKGRDAVAAPAPWAVGKLSGAGADWNALGGGGALWVTVARRDASGSVIVTRERAAPVIAARRLETPRAARQAARPRKAAAATAARGLGSGLRRARAARAARGRERAETAELELELEAWEPEEPDEGEIAQFGSPSLKRKIGSWFSKARERRERRQARGARKVRLSLRQLLGNGILRPPLGKLVPPDFAALGPAPKLPKGGGDWPRLTPSDLEKLAPPDTEEGYKGWYRDVRANPGHWHLGERGEYFHKTGAWGVLLEGPKWAWLPKSGDRWWVLGENAPLVWHGAHWWWKTEDGWFLLHRGQAWAYRFFNDLERDGLFEPESRARIVYSADAKRVAVIIPGRETIVYDLESGQVLGRIPAD